MKDRLFIFLKGLFMGMADIVPGVSGGTIALITGIYEKFIFSINALNSKNIRQLLKSKRKLETLKKMQSDFLLTILAGIAVAFLGMSYVVKYMMNSYPANTYAFFFGLILASAGFVYRYVGKLTSKTIITGIIGFIFAFMFVGLSAMQTSHSMPVIFFSGFVAICAMLLPGISGAFILFFLGQYEFMLSALHEPNIPLIAVFMVGAISGLLVMSRVLNYLLKKHKAATMSFLLGLMLGALRMPYENVISNQFQMPLVLISCVIGFATVIILEKSAKRMDSH